VTRAHGRRPNPRKNFPERRRDAEAKSDDVALLYGAHTVREALLAGKRELLTLYATENAWPRIAEDASRAGLEPRLVEARELTRQLGEEAVHQGLLLEARPLPELSLGEIESKSGVVLALDQITDPHNVGAMLRSAAAFAVDTAVVTERHGPQFSGVLAKAASGALEHVPIVTVVNLARSLEQLSRQGFWLVGLDSEGETDLEEAPLRAPVALALGAEGKGLRRLTRERCDVVARLDMPGPIKSLNVSNACAIALSVLHRRLASLELKRKKAPPGVEPDGA
jgi:23S rRNA (guanosine2251-2'-O)-methyltransferase